MKLKKYLVEKGISKAEVDGCPDKAYLLLLATNHGIEAAPPAQKSEKPTADAGKIQKDSDCRMSTEAEAKQAEAAKKVQTAKAEAAKSQTTNLEEEVAQVQASNLQVEKIQGVKATAKAENKSVEVAAEAKENAEAAKAHTESKPAKKLSRVQQMALAAQQQPILGGTRPALKTIATVARIAASTSAASNTVSGSEQAVASLEPVSEVAAKPKGASGRRLPSRRPRPPAASVTATPMPVTTAATTTPAAPAPSVSPAAPQALECTCVPSNKPAAVTEETPAKKLSVKERAKLANPMLMGQARPVKKSFNEEEVKSVMVTKVQQAPTTTQMSQANPLEPSNMPEEIVASDRPTDALFADPALPDVAPIEAIKQSGHLSLFEDTPQAKKDSLFDDVQAPQGHTITSKKALSLFEDSDDEGANGLFD